MHIWLQLAKEPLLHVQFLFEYPIFLAAYTLCFVLE